MATEKKPAPRKPAVTPEIPSRKRRNAWEPQVIVPQQVDLPLARSDMAEVTVPSLPNGRSLISGRL